MPEQKERKYKIIIVEDDPDTAAMFERMLNIKGYDVVKIFRASEALAQIIDQKPNAVLLDIMMPDLSGLDVLREMRRNSDSRDVPVIILSARATPVDIQQGLEAGAEYYLTKPISFNDLDNVLKKILARNTMGAII